MNTRQIHEYTRTKPINIKLHQRATKIWKKLEDLENPTYENLRNNLHNINRYNKWFPSSLAKSLAENQDIDISKLDSVHLASYRVTSNNDKTSIHLE